MFRTLAALVLLALLAAAGASRAEEIGSVDTAFKLLGPDHRIVVEAFDDPEVPGVACHIARARKGGISGALGLAEETSDASIACRQVGPVSFAGPLEQGDRVFRERRSILFKSLQVVRFYDAKRHVLIYLSYSDKLIDGSPKNSISTVPLMSWNGTPAPRPEVSD